MLRQLSLSHANGRSKVIHPLRMKHAPSVVIVSWQRSEHGYISLKYETWSVIGSWQRSEHGEISLKYSMKHAPSDFIVSWQRSEHGYILLMNETCSVRCLCLITTDRAWLYIPKVWNMLGQLSSSRDNVHSMVIYPYSINHATSVVIISRQRSEHGNISLIYKNAPSVVIVTWQRSEHSNISLMCETSSVSCHQLMTTVRAWQYIPHV